MLRKIKSLPVTELVLCLLCAVLLSLAFSFRQCWILAWLGFVPLFFALDKKGAKKAFFLAYFTGVLFWLGTVYWLAYVTLFGLALLILYLALYFGLFGILFSLSYPLPAIYRLLFIPASWVLLEYLRSHLLTGFPWALLGYSQYANLPFIQIADLGGVWLVSFLVMFINAAVKEAISRKQLLYVFFTCMLITAAVLYGFLKLKDKGSSRDLRISVVQGNIPQELKWSPAAREFIIGRYFSLDTEAVKDTPDLIIWPEASFPVIPEEEPVYYEKLQRFVEGSARPLLFGAVTERDDLYFNSALMLSKEARLTQRYDKLHLVPFGEYIPFRKSLPFLETIAPIGDIARGREYSLFKIQNQKSRTQYQFGVLICFEDIFPELARGFVNRGADFLVNITNDAWFGRNSEAYQHLAASVFRAVENRVFLARSANTGISGFITPQGKIIALVEDGEGNSIFVSGYRTCDIFIRGQSSLYRHYGDFLIILCLICVLCVWRFRITKVKS